MVYTLSILAFLFFKVFFFLITGKQNLCLSAMNRKKYNVSFKNKIVIFCGFLPVVGYQLQIFNFKQIFGTWKSWIVVTREHLQSIFISTWNWYKIHKSLRATFEPIVNFYRFSARKHRKIQSECKQHYHQLFYHISARHDFSPNF